MSEMRRDDDKVAVKVLELVTDISRRMNAHIEHTNNYREQNDRLFASHRDAIKKNGEAVECLKESFQDYEKRNAPLLEELASNKKFKDSLKEKIAEHVASSIILSGIGAVSIGAYHAAKTFFKIS